MSFLRRSLAAIPFAAIAAGAQAGQIFSFENPIPNGSYNNAMFQTASLFAGNPSPVASIQNIYGGNVTLNVSTFTDQGAFLGTTPYAAKYYLSNSADALANGTFQGNKTSGPYATGSGLLTFVTPTTNAVLLRISFSASSLSFGNLAGAGSIGFSGSLLTTGETGNENLSFGFPNRYTASGSQSDSVARVTGSFTSSIGRVSTVPEPASMTALAVGGLALLRRKRRS